MERPEKTDADGRRVALYSHQSADRVPNSNPRLLFATGVTSSIRLFLSTAVANNMGSNAGILTV